MLAVVALSFAARLADGAAEMLPSRGMGKIAAAKAPKTTKKRDGNEPVALFARGGVMPKGKMPPWGAPSGPRKEKKYSYTGRKIMQFSPEEEEPKARKV